ncbi:hypothetical protein MPLSOD_10564 [Mesorhizobium sp. SOD10]|nr:hypothetical protein MPLSOD_10564 [Mesorhizobium sp. SOD10]
MILSIHPYCQSGGETKFPIFCLCCSEEILYYTGEKFSTLSQNWSHAEHLAWSSVGNSVNPVVFKFNWLP